LQYNINGVFFSATATTKKVVSQLAHTLAQNYNTKALFYDFTLPKNREKSLHFTPKDLVIVGVPVYAGRVPNVLLKYLNNQLKAQNSLAVAVVVYGNRHYDDALIELKDILQQNGFNTIAGAAFIGEHSFSKILAKNRPDSQDLKKVEDFAQEIFNKLKNQNLKEVKVLGNPHFRNYYQPKDKKGHNFDFKIIKPKTHAHCTNCKICVGVCPIGSIDYNNVAKLNSFCIKCGACVKNCPVSAKYFDDENYLKHKHELEKNYSAKKEPECFL